MQLNKSTHVSAAEVISAQELNNCDFTFELSHAITFPFDELDNIRLIATRQKDYKFDPLGIIDDAADRLALFAAYVLGHFAGYVAITEQWNGMAEIAEIVVDRKARGQGVASLLLESAEAWAREEGYHFMRLEAQANNPAACRLYKKSGYELGGFDRFLYAGGKDDGDIALFWYRKLV